MSTSESSSTSAQDQYLEAVREGQEAWANAVRAWSDSVQRMWGDAASTTTGEAPTAEQVIDNVFGFAEQLLAAQRDFAKRLVQATAPARYEADPLGRLTPLCTCSTAGRSTFRRAAANSGADGSAVRSARRAQRRRGKCASHR